MNLHDLQEHLRAHIRARIARGEMTGISLSRAAGFPQGHLSNFLNARRGLSVESMDRLLATLGVGILDLVNPEDLQHRMALPRPGHGTESVALVAAENAALARFSPSHVLETRTFNKEFLHRLKPRTSEDRRDWQRFVVIKLTMRDPTSALFQGVSATLLIDRHYSSLRPYRRSRPNIYAVSVRGTCVTGYVSLHDRYLLLRPRDPRQEVEMLRIAPGRDYSEHIIGRVCHVGLET
jgi:hypothetical protein